MTDSSPEATAPTPRDTTFDARMIDDLRRYRRAVPSDVVPVTLDELDALLAAADERDALKREACAEPAIHPDNVGWDETPEQALRQAITYCVAPSPWGPSWPPCYQERGHGGEWHRSNGRRWPTSPDADLSHLAPGSTS